MSDKSEQPPNQQTLTNQQALELAVQHHNSGRLHQAETIYQKILQNNPKHPVALHLLGVIAHQIGDHDKAIDQITTALNLNPDYAEAHSNLGLAFKELEQLEEAIASYRKALALKPDMAEAHYNLGNALKEFGKSEEAVASYRGALSLNPDYADAYNNLGVALKDLGKSEEAIASYHKALELNPDYADAYNNLGVALKDLGKSEEAIANYRKLLALNPDDFQAHNNLGVTLKELGKSEEAITSYRKALALKPDMAEAHYNLGNILKDLGQLNDAADCYHKALVLRPDYGETHNNLGLAFQKLGKVEEAIGSYRKALALNPNMAEAHNNLGNALKDLGSLDEAAASYHKALVLQPDYAEAHNNLGVTLKERGQLEEAIANYRKALTLKPGLAEAHLNLGTTLQDLGKLEDAATSYHKALELNPNDINSRVSLAKNTDRLVPFWHIPMMNDHLRNDAYLAALQKAVTVGTHVLEIGTGSGLLAMMAVRCRAENVTTCEASPLIAATAKEIISTNGMADTINVIAKKSTNVKVGVDLERSADLLVFEIFSSEFLAEGVLSSVEDAKRRLLNPKGRIIPSGGSIMVALFGGQRVGQNVMVDEVSGFDLSKFNSITSNRKFFQANHFDIKLLTDDIEAFSFDFNENSYFSPEKKLLKIPITTAADCHGIIQWNRMRMDDDIIFENHPSIKTAASGWSHVAYLFDKPIEVKPRQTAIVSAMHNRDLPWFALDDITEP